MNKEPAIFNIPSPDGQIGYFRRLNIKSHEVIDGVITFKFDNGLQIDLKVESVDTLISVDKDGNPIPHPSSDGQGYNYSFTPNIQVQLHQPSDGEFENWVKTLEE